jgi:hypothetical protein
VREARKEGELAYELEALETGQRMALRASDWEILLGLAYRHGWRPSAGLDSYLGGGRRVIAASEARALAEALAGPLADLPPERRQELRAAEGAPGGPIVGASPSRPEADYEGHFAWQRRWILAEVIMFCRRGAMEVRPM